MFNYFITNHIASYDLYRTLVYLEQLLISSDPQIVLVLVFKTCRYSIISQLENQLVQYTVLSVHAQKFDFYNDLLPIITSFQKITVVATTRPMSNSSTTSKSQSRISSGKHELCNSQENSTGNHNSILLTIYINYPQSMLQLYICCVSYSNVHVVVATTCHSRTNDLTTSKALQWAIK